MSRKGERANETGRLRAQIRRKDFIGPVLLVLACVVEDVVKFWANLADRQGAPCKNPDRQFAASNEALNHDFVVVSKRGYDRRLQFLL
jgi:hypothetical protein